MDQHLISWIVFLPMLAGLALLFVPREFVKWVALAGSGAAFLCSLCLIGTFWGGDSAGVFGEAYGKLHHVERVSWITGNGFSIEYFVGIDGLSFPLFLLTTFVSLLACLASFNFDSWKINKGIKAYFFLFLLLETGMLGVFVSLDFFLFYVFWEVMLLPMYFLIGVWGGARREYAAIKFFIFTLAGSVLMLVGLVAMFFYSADAVAKYPELATSYSTNAPLTTGTFDLIELTTNEAIQKHFSDNGTMLLGLRFAPMMFMFLFIGFAIKLPSFPVHTWLPDAHVEAPTPVSMVLAGVLLKMGGYGFLRLCYAIFPLGGEFWASTLAVIAIISILYGALCAMAQTDFKRLVAYSSISHMGYVLLGICVMTKTGVQGAMFQMIAHGISSPMCFFLVGVIYDRAHHREINRFGGLWLSMPRYGSMATLGFFASLGLPGLCGFIGEVYVLLGVFEAGPIYPWAYTAAICAAFGVVLTAGYILWVIQRVYLGQVREEYKDFPEANGRELLILAPLGALCILLGVLPKQTVFDFMNGTLNLLVDQMNGATQMAVAAVGG